MKEAKLVAVIGVVAAMFVVAMVVPAGAKGKPPPVTWSGTVSCKVNAKISYSPPLRAGGTATSETITLKTKLFDCTGTVDGARVANGKSTVVTTASTNDCTAVLTAPGGGVPGDIAWKSSNPKLNPSTVVLGPGTTSQGPPITVDSTGSATAGSFNGDTAHSHSVISQSLAYIQKKCSTTGLKALHINPSGSTFSLS
jgi:hypothetical protein